MEKSQSCSSASTAKQPLGELLVEAGLVSIGQIELALQEQQENDKRIGEILASHGWIKQKTVDFLSKNGRKFSKKKRKNQYHTILKQQSC